MSILYPVLILVLLTFIVTLRLAFTRVRHLRSQRIHPQNVATRSGAVAHFGTAEQLSDHYLNLFEMPVLFYLLAVLLLVLKMDDTSFAVLGWLYVALRGLHSWIHCSYNKVIHRFYAFVASTAVLIGMWVQFALRLI